MITREAGRIRITGPLTHETVRTLYDGGLQSGGASTLEVDLSEVAAVDSAAVSLLLAWLREAQRSDLRVRFLHVPDNLLSLARLYGVAEMLALDSSAGATA